MSEMYGVVNMRLYPHEQDPRLISLELFGSFAEAVERSEELMVQFREDYGEEYFEHATERKPVAIMFNGEVTEYAYIAKVNLP